MKKIMLILFIVLFSSFAFAQFAGDTPENRFSFDNDDVSGSALSNTGSTGNDATITDAVTGRGGKFAESFYFDGTNDKVVTDANLGISGDSDRSISVWFKSNSTYPSLGALTWWGTSACTRQYMGFTLSTTAGGYRMGVGCDDFTTGDKGLNDGTWHNLIFRYSSSNSTGYYYVDGTLDTIRTYGGALATVNTSLYMGLRPDDGGDLHGNLDEVCIWDSYITDDDITQLQSYTCSAAAPPTPTSNITANFTYPTPSNGEIVDFIPTINLTCFNTSNQLRYLWADTNNPPTTMRLSNSSTGILNTSSFASDGNTYYYTGACYDNDLGLITDNTSIQSFTIDEQDPEITLNPSTSFNASNYTSDEYAQYLNLNFSFVDDRELYATIINVTDNVGTVKYVYENYSVTGATLNLSLIVDTSSWNAGIYTVDVQASDSHTAKAIKDYDVKSKPRRFFNLLGRAGLEYDTAEGNTISIESDDDADTASQKSLDRYDFQFNFKDNQVKTRTFHIRSVNPITYVKDSHYKAHFVISSDGVNGNWVDFEGVEGTPTVTKISDYHYKITFDNVGKNVRFNSIGGLNTNQKTFTYTKSTLSLTQNFILPSTPININDLNAYVNATEGRGHDVSYEYKWYKNGNLYQNASLIGTNFTEGVLTAISNITSANTSENDVFIFSARSYSRGNYTIWSNSSSITISAYGIDDCTIYNVSALTFNYKSITGSAVNVNISSNIEYGIEGLDATNYSFTKSNTSTFSYCIFPENQTFFGHITKQYLFQNDIFNYFTNNTILNRTNRNITLYVEDGDEITATVFDNQVNKVEGAYIHVQRYDWDTSTFIPVGEVKTNFEGEAKLYLTKDSVYYRFLIFYPINQLREISSSTYVHQNTIEFTINLYDEVAEQFYESRDITYTLDYINSSNTFRYIFTDPSANINQGCLKVWKNNAYGNVLLNNSCVSSTSGTINIPITVQNQTSYTAKAYVYFSGDEYILDSITHHESGNNEIGNLGLLVVFILTIVFAFTIRVSLSLGVLLIPIPTLFASMVGFIPLDPMIAGSLQLGAFIIAIFINNRQ